MPDEINYYGLVNKPPIDEIRNLDLINKPDLMHYGILGMKWGVRRYQNPDGTLTELGKKRISNNLTKRERKIAKRVERAKLREAKKREKFYKKRSEILKDPNQILKYQDMFSNDEISKAIDRIRLIDNVKDLNHNKLRKGKQLADTMLSYGDVLNNGIRFINSDAGKFIRSKMGLPTNTILDFNAKERKAQQKQEALEKQREELKNLEFEVQKELRKQELEKKYGVKLSGGKKKNKK
jgi:hypothetical protein